MTVELRAGAWHGDAPLHLTFPSSWDLSVVRMKQAPALTPEALQAMFDHPVGTVPLRQLARGRRSAAVVVDDATRPTPAAAILPGVLRELEAGGISRDDVVLVVATGTHPPPSPAELEQKIGPAIAGTLKTVVHDSRGELVSLRASVQNIPLMVNRHVMACDLKIGIGCVYPHPAAGFSGGGKTVIPGVCGIETIREIHDTLRAAPRRGEGLGAGLRRGIESMARTIGLDFSINVIVNESREVAAGAAGDFVAAHRRAVELATSICGNVHPPDADVIFADAYPFDGTLQFAHDRALWPFSTAARGASCVLLASCPGGRGGHEFFPAERPIAARIGRRLRHLRYQDVARIPSMIRTTVSLARELRREVLVFAAGVNQFEVSRVFPRGIWFGEWEPLIATLQHRHPQTGTRAVLYRTAPLLFTGADPT